MLNAAVIGLGWWGKQIVTCLADSDRIAVRRGVDVNLDDVRGFAAGHGFDLGDSYDDVLADDDIDAVILVTPHALHEEQVLAAAAAGKVIDPLFWCMGSWGATYPIAGDIHFDDSVEAWAGLAARGVFMMGRLGALTISSEDGCSFVPQPVWTKSRYKLQIMEPVKGGKCVNIGRPGALWSSAKHAPGKDNAQFLLFEKVICCAGIPVP